jgi:hypothetical protein
LLDYNGRNSTSSDGTTLAPAQTEGHDVGFAENAMTNMLQSIVFRSGGQTVSECQALQPQVDKMVRKLDERNTSQLEKRLLN